MLKESLKKGEFLLDFFFFFTINSAKKTLVERWKLLLVYRKVLMGEEQQDQRQKWDSVVLRGQAKKAEHQGTEG